MACHQTDGRGMVNLAPLLANSPWALGLETCQKRKRGQEGKGEKGSRKGVRRRFLQIMVGVSEILHGGTPIILSYQPRKHLLDVMIW